MPSMFGRVLFRVSSSDRRRTDVSGGKETPAAIDT